LTTKSIKKIKLWDILKNTEAEEKLAPKKEELEKEIRKNNFSVQ
jgi:hypothetical protein